MQYLYGKVDTTMNDVFETVAEVFEELRSEAEGREYYVQTKEAENADIRLKKANQEYRKLLAEISVEHREFLENYMDIVDHAHFQEEQRFKRAYTMVVNGTSYKVHIFCNFCICHIQKKR